MIITKTPYRMSFLGGGTDYKSYFMEYGGSVISTTIDKYCYISVRELPPFFEHSIMAKYSYVEAARHWDDIKHPSIRECLRYTDINNISISHDGDLPARSGLGSSSAFTVGLLNALHALKGEYCDKLSLAKEAIYVEQEMIGENVGVQDQIAVAVGGLNRINFSADGYKVRPIVISHERKEELNNKLMLFFTGHTRIASEIAKTQIENTKNKLSELHTMVSLVDEGEKILSSNVSLDEFGKLLDETWKLKRGLTSLISTSAIDDIYSKAIHAGAIGGKLLGAGGGGFIMFYVEPEKQQLVRNELKDYLEVPFSFEQEGSVVAYYASEEAYK